MHQSHDAIGRLYPVNLFWHYFPSLVGNQWKTFKDQISDAVKSYTPCNAANCSCHLRWMWDANVLCFLCHTLKINSYCCINDSEGLTHFSLWRSSFLPQCPTTWLAAIQRENLRRCHGSDSGKRSGHPLPDHWTQVVQGAQLYVSRQVRRKFYMFLLQIYSQNRLKTSVPSSHSLSSTPLLAS